VVVTSVADPFNGEIVDGLEQTAYAAGYSVVLATSQADPGRELSIVHSFRERRVDGIIVASSRVGALYSRHLTSLHGPIVLLNNQSAGFSNSVTIDNVSGAGEATEHLAELGHTKIAYIGDSIGMRSDAERKRGYRDALARRGLPAIGNLVANGDGKAEGGRHAASHLLSLRNPPTAIFCYNDMTALGVLEEASARKLQIPRDLSVCGFDDLFFTSFLQPALTTVHQPKRELGEQAMKILLQLLAGEKLLPKIKLKGDLIIRSSTAPPPRS
jgi:DNA-binding LacI/PurR family transcriptional regulator